MTKQASPKYSPEVRERAVRMVFEHEGDHASQWAAIGSIAAKIGCNAETLRGWVGRPSATRGNGPGRPATTGSGSRHWSGKSANCARPTRSCARRRRILPRRSSTAGPSHDRVHRRSPRRLRGRADLQGAADRPVDLPCPCRLPGRSQARLGPGQERRGSEPGDPAGTRTSRSTACARSGGS